MSSKITITEKAKDMFDDIKQDLRTTQKFQTSKKSKGSHNQQIPSIYQTIHEANELKLNTTYGQSLIENHAK